MCVESLPITTAFQDKAFMGQVQESLSSILGMSQLRSSNGVGVSPVYEKDGTVSFLYTWM